VEDIWVILSGKDSRPELTVLLFIRLVFIQVAFNTEAYKMDK